MGVRVCYSVYRISDYGSVVLHATSISLKKSWFTLGIIMLLVSVMTIFFALKQYHRVTDRDKWDYYDSQCSGARGSG